MLRTHEGTFFFSNKKISGISATRFKKYFDLHYIIKKVILKHNFDVLCIFVKKHCLNTF